MNIFEYEFRKQIYKVNNNGMGYFIKSPTPFYYSVINGKTLKKHGSKAFCDFVGVVNGTFYLLELKSVSGTRFEKRRLGKDQRNKLNKVQLNRGISLVAIKFSSTDDLFLIPYEKYIEIENKYIKKSLNLNDFLIEFIDCKYNNFVEYLYNRNK